MPPPPLPGELRSYRDRLDALFNKVSELPEDDLQMRAHWASYLCVLTSGLIEVGLRSIALSFATDAASPAVVGFVDRQLGRVQNPNMEIVLRVVRSFSEDWAASLEAKTDGEIAASVNSVI